jgi:hypothetical protein
MAIHMHRRYPQWAPPGTALIGPLPKEEQARREAIDARLRELARVALALLDIDALRDCVLPASRGDISPDDYAYNIDLFNAAKRGLLRVERLSDLDPQVALWRRRPDKLVMADLVMVGTEYTQQFSGWDRYTIPIPPAMQTAFDGVPATAYSADSRSVSVFAPLWDSLDDVVAVLELCVGLNR